MFLPPPSLAPRIAPTERCAPLAWPCNKPDAPFLRGIVHDPTSRRMGGVAGHAGLFSTAADLSRFCRMLLDGGRLGAVRVLSPASVARMTSVATPPGMADVRGLGWDLDSVYSANRGELFPIGSYGHTGFTGTSLWLDPRTKSYVIFLSNRVHPDGKGDATPIRAKVATVVAAAILSPADVRALPADAWRSAMRPADREADRPARPATIAGIDVLAGEGFERLRGKRVGLLTNQNGRTAAGVSTIDALFNAKDVKLVALFSPEHGIRGELDENVASSKDDKTGLPIYSLYGDTRRPTDAMLQGIDALVIDLQDIGARIYTYPAAIGYVLEEAAPRKLPVFLLDRPNPVDGFDVEGPVQDSTERAYTGYFRLPIRHGLTLGELARVFNAELKIGADLTVVPMKNWRRDEWFDETGLVWVNPSPNMRNMVAASLYPGIGAIEGTNISVGRGTDSPFEQIGAPWIDAGGAGRGAQRARARRDPLLSGELHAGGGREARRPGLPRRVHDRHRSRSPAPGARGARDRVSAGEDVRSAVQTGGCRVALRIGGDAGESARGRGSRVDRRVVERGRSEVAPPAREISSLLTCVIARRGVLSRETTSAGRKNVAPTR